MVANYNVISKGEYTQPQKSKTLRVGRFLIVRKRKRRMVLLELQKSVTDTLTALKVQVDAFDAKGNELGAVVKEWKRIALRGEKFLLNKPIGVHPSCVDVRVSILSATCGHYVYKLGKDGEYVVYKRKKPREKLDEKEVLAKTGKEGFDSAPRKFKSSVAVGVVAGIAVLSIVGAGLYQALSYEKGETFYLHNIAYELTEDEYRESAPVKIVGVVGLGAKELVIPNNIEGHPVVEIKSGAFSGNKNIEKVTVEKGVTVSASAFKNCANLKSVELKGENVIEDYAFAYCGSLQTVNAYDLKSIGDNSFYSTSGLKKVKITSSKEDTDVLTIGVRAFTGATEMEEIHIDDYVAYDESTPVFPSVYSVDKLYLKQYNRADYETNVDKPISAIFSPSIEASIREITIGEMDKIPAYFCENDVTLTKMTVGKLDSASIGECAFRNCSALEELSLSKKLVGVGNYALSGTALKTFDASNLQSLGVGAFADCAKLTNVNFGTTTLEEISNHAFTECPVLAEIVLPASVKKIGSNAFGNCESLRTITLPNSVERVGAFAFAGNYNLRYLSIPASVTHMSNDAFQGCYRLHEIENLSALSLGSIDDYAVEVYTSALDPRITKVETGNMVFGKAGNKWYALEYKGVNDTYTFPANVQGAEYRLTDYLFYRDPTLETVYIPSGVAFLENDVFSASIIKSIVFQGTGALAHESEAFYGMGDLERVDFGNRAYGTVDTDLFANSKETLQEVNLSASVVAIADRAFKNYTALQKVTGGSVKRIGENAFNGCSSLTELPSNGYWEEIGSNAFTGCTLLSSVATCANLETIGEAAFYGCVGLQSVGDMPSLNKIGEYAFGNCYALQGVGNMPSLTEIGSGAFGNCEGLQRVGGCPNLEKIHSNAFSNCTSLTAFTFSSALRTLGEYAFRNCTSLTCVDIPDGLTTISWYAFQDCSAMEKVYLPSTISAINDYAFWGCTSLHEVYNFTGDTLTIDSMDDGCVAYNAVIIHTTRGSGLTKVTASNGVVYKYSSKVCAAVDYEGSGSSVIIDFNGHFAQKYVVARGAFAWVSGVQDLTIGEWTSEIRSGAFVGMTDLRTLRFQGASSLVVKQASFSECYNLSKLVIAVDLGGIDNYAIQGVDSNVYVYYEGDASQWSSVGAYRYRFDFYVVKRYYDACAHASNEWRYGANGEIDESNKPYALSEIITAPTCTTYGEELLTCPTCGKTKTQSVAPLEHNIVDGQCTRCEYFYYALGKGNETGVADVVTIVNDANNAFDLFKTTANKIYLPKGQNITATLTFTAHKNMTITFTSRVYGAVASLKAQVTGGSATTLYGDNQKTYTLYAGQTLTFTCALNGQLTSTTNCYLSNIQITSL